MEKFLSIKGVDWLYEYAPSKEFKAQLIETYDLHELIEEDLFEYTTQDKIDVYDHCLFLILHFPKFNTDSRKYLLNEFNIVLGKNFIVTITKYKSSQIDKIKANYLEMLDAIEQDEQYKFSPYYILYKLVDAMYDKVLRGLRFFASDLSKLEDSIFEGATLDLKLLEQIMQQRRNIVMLKHMIQPHQEIIDQIQEETTKFYGEELDVYFEDLAYKIDKILSNINVQEENIDSLYDIYSTMVNMRTNSAVTVLTIFTAILGVMTLITGFYGMNVDLPYAQNTMIILYIVGGMLLTALCMLVFFRHKGWIK